MDSGVRKEEEEDDEWEGGGGTSEGRSGGRERVKGDRQPANLIRPSRDFLVTPVVSASLSPIPLLLPFSAFFSLSLFPVAFLLFFLPFLPPLVRVFR